MSKNEVVMRGTETVSLFCRLNIHTKKDIPVRPSEMGLLILVVNHDSPVTPVMAADFFKVKKPMITAMINRLAAQSYITKEPSQEDKRSFTLIPTDKALALVHQTNAEYFKSIDALQKGMGDDYEILIGLLDKANKILLKEKNNG